MVVSEITKLLEKRKNDLIDLLEYDSSIDLEKQHQIYGAINEIEIFLQTLNYFRDREIKDEINTLKLARPQEEDFPIKKLMGDIKGKFFKNKG